MGGFGHGPAVPAEAEDMVLAARNARYGRWLFLLYFVIYAGFVGLNAFAPQTMAINIAGIHLAVWYGLALIVTAMVLAMIYVWLCRRPSA
ncbi:DUF485 domain-containing protein [bacterium]|nr:DUF485 domain-containing protein [bacterium]